MEQDKALQLTLNERNRQDELFGAMPRNHNPVIWGLLIAEELGEAIEEIDLDLKKTDPEVTQALSDIIQAGRSARMVLGQNGRDILEKKIVGEAKPEYLKEMVQVAALAIAALEDAPELNTPALSESKITEIIKQAIASDSIEGWQLVMESLSRPQAKIIVIIHDNQPAPNVNKIAELSFSSPKTVSAQLMHLRKLGLVKKETGTGDHRESYYSIAETQLKEYLDFNMRRMHPVL